MKITRANTIRMSIKHRHGLAFFLLMSAIHSTESVITSNTRMSWFKAKIFISLYACQAANRYRRCGQTTRNNRFYLSEVLDNYYESILVSDSDFLPEGFALRYSEERVIDYLRCATLCYKEVGLVHCDSWRKAIAEFWQYCIMKKTAYGHFFLIQICCCLALNLDSLYICADLDGCPQMKGISPLSMNINLAFSTYQNYRLLKKGIIVPTALKGMIEKECDTVKSVGLEDIDTAFSPAIDSYIKLLLTPDTVTVPVKFKVRA